MCEYVTDISKETPVAMQLPRYTTSITQSLSISHQSLEYTLHPVSGLLISGDTCSLDGPT
jgi:hypothetical protein